MWRPAFLASFAACFVSAGAVGAQSLTALEVEGFRAAVVFVPKDDATKRPVILALHGNYDRPEWQCETWRGIVADAAFVLCPRGIPRADAPPAADRWTWNGFAQTQREVEAALAAFEARYPERVSKGAVVLAGFSLGATMAARLAIRRAELYARLVLVEGGSDAWTLAVARRYTKSGGKRILAACGQPACFPRFRALGWAFKTADLPFRVVGARRAGHTYDGDVANEVAANWSWLVEGDPSFGE